MFCKSLIATELSISNISLVFIVTVAVARNGFTNGTPIPSLLSLHTCSVYTHYMSSNSAKTVYMTIPMRSFRRFPLQLRGRSRDGKMGMYIYPYTRLGTG
ncbi:uncharacterized protein EI97DRAFT_137837 [Westerdykella ornata]|uniref:Uncharacterized protein n=1 Tax=Westerdykella ornata TaxID=318751 RepID=A0A6A6JC95_WESOR|nr:uncharacterized protein EI97DRAFT_137837 [Westerdykella ornata]KAF2273887.1 hypothetical protein EI97DRAFT_137837 [Westerdykella ornata]